MEILTKHQKAALDYSKHLSLTANAGSGKTFVLSRRYLEIALKENIDLRNIAAITFTDKAAGELYKKISTLVELKIESSADNEEIRKLNRIRRQLVSANISTIHSFCVDILREHPVEAGLDANFTAIDELTSDELIEIVTEEIIKNAFIDPNEEESLKYLIRIFASKGLFAGELARLIKKRKNVFILSEKIYSGTIEETTQFFHNEFLRLVEATILGDKEKFIRLCKKINDAVIENDPGNELAPEINSLLTELEAITSVEKTLQAIQNIIEIMCTSGGQVKKQKYTKKNNLYESLSEETNEIEKIIPLFNYIKISPDFQKAEQELARFGKTILYFFEKAVDLYDKRKKQNGYLDYEDILLFTQKILKNENVREALQNKFKYIMVDEYQDTNEVQYNIFKPILNDLKSNNLFVVGDEKQSIYMFRDAELEIFNRTKEEIKISSGSDYLLTLPDSFRMAPELCVFANVIFNRLFSNPQIFFNEVEHSDLVCARQNTQKGHVEILLQDNDDEQNTEAELVAIRIINLINSSKDNYKINWSDVAVLCRRRKWFTELEKVFIKYDIPYSIVGGKGFYQRQTIYDIYNYLAFLLDEENDTALVGILRSPFFTIPDSSIFEISLEAEENFWEKLKSYSVNRTEFAPVVSLLEENLSLAGTMNAASLIRKMFAETEFLAVVSSKQNGEQEIANLKKLIRTAVDFGNQGYRTLYDFVNYLRESIQQLEDEAQAAVTDESDSVKVMTIHQSKGLEYKAVVLYKCNDPQRKNFVSSKKITVDKNFGLLTKVPVDQNYFGEYEAPPIVGVYDLINQRKNLAETKRLFYVAVTRAIDYLFISAELPSKGTFPPDSFMGLMLEGLNSQIENSTFDIKSELQYLTKKNDKFENSSGTVEFEIPVLNEIELVVNLSAKEETTESKKQIDIENIIDHTKGEFISATKVAVYNQCPVKYQLTYEYGAKPLMEGYKKQYSKDYEFSPYEAEEISIDEEQEKSVLSGSGLKGRIIHKILELEIPENALENFIKKELDNEINLGVDSSEMNNLTTEIMNDVKKFYGSENYAQLSSYTNYFNEYEIYAKENDYYLYGIVDRLVIDKNKILIVDYKTDSIEKSELKERAESYFIQLKFYAYIISRHYKNVDDIGLRLVFTKYPDEKFGLKINPADLAEIQSKIKKMVTDIREGSFNKNLNHCSKCFFALDLNKCVVH